MYVYVYKIYIPVRECIVYRVDNVIFMYVFVYVCVYIYIYIYIYIYVYT